MPSGPSRGEPKRVVELGYRRAGTAVETVQWRGGRTHGGPARTGGASPNANGADPKVDPTLTGAWSFRRRRLAPSVVAVGPRSEDRFPLALSPALAPASGSVRWWFGSEDPLLPSGGSETGSSVGRSTVGAAVPAEAEVPCLASDRSIRPMVTSLSRSSRTTDLHRTEVLNMTISKTARTVVAIPIWFEIFRSFNPLGLSVQRISPRLDDLKVPLGPESRKAARPALSTVHAFGCGHGWITQRLVDKC